MSKTTKLAEFQKWIQTREVHDIECWLTADFWHNRLNDSDVFRAFQLYKRGVDIRTKCIDGVRHTATIEIAYNYFEPGTYVAPASAHASLPAGIYKVLECYRLPFIGNDEAIMVVKDFNGRTHRCRTSQYRKATKMEKAYGLVDWPKKECCHGDSGSAHGN